MCWQASPAVCLLLGKLPQQNAVAQQKAAYKTRGGPKGEKLERGVREQVNEGENMRGMGRGVAARQPVRRTESERGTENLCVYEKESENTTKQ